MRWMETFPAERYSARLARRFVQDRLLEFVGSVVLMVDELVTNAILHGEGPGFGLRLSRRDPYGVVRVEVRDLSAKAPKLADWGLPEEHGHGLHIVQRLADRWGWHGVPGGKVTWFESRRP